jgi:putative PIN family toxin of toxin-antitoxin system
MRLIVLDTNVVLDLLIFLDPAVRPIDRALRSNAAVCVTNRECRAELARVLAYPRFELGETRQRDTLRAYDAMTRMLPEVESTSAAFPRCSDPDDQKFIDLAYGCAAQLLITKDDAVLRLARGAIDLVRIVTPDRAGELLDPGTAVHPSS